MSRFLRHFIAVAGLLLLTAKISFAIDLGFAREDGGQAGAFLDFGASARSLGMGRAHAGVADDASAIYWNPAGLTQIERKDVVTQYSVLHEDTGFGSFSYAHPTVDLGSLAFGIVSLRSQNFEKRDFSGEKIGAYDESETAILLADGVSLNESMALGMTVKMVRQEIDAYSSTGAGVDLGALYRFRPKVQFGLVAHNLLAPTMKLKSVRETFPRNVRLGMQLKPGEHFVIAIDAEQAQRRSTKIHFGTEYQVNKLLALRVGLNETEITTGLGFKIGDFALDYSLGYHDAASGVDDLGTNHRFGFHMNFGKTVSDQGASLRWQRKGEQCLIALRDQMERRENPLSEEAIKLIATTKQVIRHQGYIKPEGLYTAQGYVYFLEREFERSVQSLSEAIALNPKNFALIRHFAEVRAELSEEKTRDLVSDEMKVGKENYDRGRLRDAIKSFEKVLSLKPDSIEAIAYLDDAKKRLNEPIEREMKIAKMKVVRGEHLDAIKSLQKVKEMDPENTEAAQMITRAIQELEKQASQEEPVVAANDTNRRVYEVSQDPSKSRELYSQGLLLYSEGKLAEASSAWERAVRLDEANLPARNAYNRAVTEIREKK